MSDALYDAHADMASVIEEYGEGIWARYGLDTAEVLTFALNVMGAKSAPVFLHGLAVGLATRERETA